MLLKANLKFLNQNYCSLVDIDICLDSNQETMRADEATGILTVLCHLASHLLDHSRERWAAKQILMPGTVFKARYGFQLTVKKLQLDRLVYS